MNCRTKVESTKINCIELCCSDLTPENLPIVTTDEVSIIGSTESISIFESFFNFRGESSLAEVKDRYPIVQLYSDIDGETVYKTEMLNKYRFQQPEYPDNHGNYP